MTDLYKETIDGWNELADAYQQNIMPLDLYDESYDLFLQSLPAEDSMVLDIACGPGNISKYLSTQNAKLKIDGIDSSANMINLAKKNVANGNFFVHDVRKLKELNSEYNGITCGFVIPFLTKDDCASMIHQCYDLINDNGIFYISFAEGTNDRSGYQTGSTGLQIYFRYYTEADVADMVKNAGFKLIRSFHINYTRSRGADVHTVIIAKKSSHC